MKSLTVKEAKKTYRDFEILLVMARLTRLVKGELPATISKNVYMTDRRWAVFSAVVFILAVICIIGFFASGQRPLSGLIPWTPEVFFVCTVVLSAVLLWFSVRLMQKEVSNHFANRKILKQDLAHDNKYGIFLTKDVLYARNAFDNFALIPRNQICDISLVYNKNFRESIPCIEFYNDNDNDCPRFLPLFKIGCEPEKMFVVLKEWLVSPDTAFRHLRAMNKQRT